MPDDEDLTDLERIGRHVEFEAGANEYDEVSQVIADAKWLLDDALAEDDFILIEENVESILRAANQAYGSDELIGRAVAVRLFDEKEAAGSHAPPAYAPLLYAWSPVFEDTHGWDDDQDQDHVRAVHDQIEAAAAIRLYCSAISDLYSEAHMAAERGETRTVIAALHALPSCAENLEDAHERWRSAMSELLMSGSHLAGPAAEAYRAAFDHTMAAQGEAAHTEAADSEAVQVDDGGLFPPLDRLL